ncbi:MAG: hypothetical protein AABN33_04800 [Acidobacteriota bacterium]
MSVIESQKERPRILAKLLLAAAIMALGANTARAQTPPPAAGGDFASEMARLVERAAELVPLIRDQVESPLMGEFENLSMWIAAIVMMLSFARVLRENDGGSKDLYYWVGRLVFCMILFGTGPTILNAMEKMGQAVVWDTPIKSAYDTQGQKFEENYKKFLEVGFTVQGDKGPIGVLTDNESPVKSIDKALNPSSWNMPQVFTVVTVARGLMEFADLFLLLLGQFIMIALRLTSPFIIAIAIDQKMAHHVAYPYIKGAAAFTLIAPAVGAIVGIFAYAAANVPLSAIDFNSPIFKLNPETLMIEGDPSRAVYPALIGAAIMLVSALALFASPYVSYRVASGQVFEGMSGVMSGWMAALTGMAVEVAGVRHGAGLERQAQTIQAHGSYGSEVTRAGASFEAGNLGVQARKLSAMAAARGALTATLGQIYGSRTQATQQAQAGQLFGVSSAGATAALAKGDIGVRLDQGVGDLNARRQRELDVFETHRSADTKRWAGDKVIMGSNWGADAIRGVTKGKSERTETVGKLGAAGLEVVGGGAGLYLQYKSIQDRAAGQKGAVNSSTDKMVEIQERAATGFSGNQDVYVRQMTEVHQRYAQDQIAAVRAGADEAAGGATRGTSITMGGISRGASMEMQANKAVLEGSIAAAGQIRDASLQAARLHMAATIVHHMTRDVARRIEQGLTMRY